MVTNNQWMDDYKLAVTIVTCMNVLIFAKHEHIQFLAKNVAI